MDDDMSMPIAEYDDDMYASHVPHDDEPAPAVQEHFAPFGETPVVIQQPAACSSGLRVMLTVFISAMLVFMLPNAVRASVEAMVPAQISFVAGPVSMGVLTVVVYALINFISGSY